MTDQEFSQGELQRSLARLERGLIELTTEVRDRHHGLRDFVTAATGPISAHSIQIENQQKAIDRLDEDVKAVTKDANRIAGAGALLAILVGIIPWPWKGGH